MGKKAHKRWTWYLIEKRSGRLIAWQSGRRTDEVLMILLGLVAHLPIRICYTDNWGAYQRVLPAHYQHVVGKSKTWKIERKNLNFRTHLKRLSRKTICFSKSEEIHDKVLSLYIERYYFPYGQFGKAKQKPSTD